MRTLDIRAEGSTRLRVVEPFPKQVESALRRADLTQAEVVDARVEAVDGGSDVSFDVAMPSANMGQKGLVARFAGWFRDLLPGSAKQSLQPMRDSMNHVVQAWRSQPSPDLADLTSAMRAQLKTVTKKTPTLRVHIKDESTSGFLVVRPSRGTQGG